MLETGVVYEVKNYRYVVDGRREAEIDILVFRRELFAWEALIIETEKKISDGKLYTTIEEALDTSITELEKIIIQIPRVKQAEETNNRIKNKLIEKYI